MKDRILLLTAILVDAINMGLTKMAESCPGASYAKLSWLQAWHIRDETYSAALAELVNAQSRQPLRSTGATEPPRPRMDNASTSAAAFTLASTKGEARNALARAVFLCRLGEIRDRNFEQHRYRASGLTLVTAAIALWNTVYTERSVRASSLTEQPVNPAHLPPPPLGWEHINLTGDYQWKGKGQHRADPGRCAPQARLGVLYCPFLTGP